VFDVVVDIRRSSPTFGRWVGVELSEENHHMLWVPPGLAHGYLVLSESADFVYRCTDFYAPSHERAIAWNDPDIGIDWPLPAGLTPTLSAKDAVAPPLREAVCFP
jgi:dTDP-4-dehydrorhamnose 3,5-epimerase